jgi:hypothetical protein
MGPSIYASIMAIERRGSGPTLIETVVKAGLAAVPVIGGSLATVVGDTLERRRDRVSEFGEAAVEALGSPEALLERLHAVERVSDLFVDGAVAASSTSMQAKRLAMGRVVARAASDDAEVELMQLVMSALADLDAPHFAILAKIAEGGQENLDWARLVTDAAPDPVVAALVRHGTVATVGTFDGGLVVSGLTSFGRLLLDYVSDSDPTR